MFLKVKVFAGQKHFNILQKSKNSFEIRVKEKTERGSANRAVLEALADYFKIPASKFRMIKGSRKSNKIFEINDNGL